MMRLGLTALAVAGCAGAPGSGPRVPAEVSRRLPACQPYEANENTWQYCVYTMAGGFPSIQDVEEICPLAGSWEAQCRHAWVAGRMQPGSGVERDALLSACGVGNDDCAFELIDFRYEEIVDDQISLCRAHAGRHAEDCSGHALQRWYMGKPDAVEVARVNNLDTGYPMKVGFWTGAAAFCAGTGTCEGLDDNRRQCEIQVGIFRKRPEGCPSQSWQVMPQNRGRGTRAPGNASPGGSPSAAPPGGHRPTSQRQASPAEQRGAGHQPGRVPPSQ